MNIDLVNETDYSIGKTDVARWVGEELKYQHCDTDVDVELMIVKPDKIRRLNKKYRRKDAVTDVLSFPLYDKIYSSSPSDILGVNSARSSHLLGSNDIKPPVLHLGTIVVCADVARKQADASNRSFDKELEHLIKHSVKHLIGIHHV